VQQPAAGLLPSLRQATLDAKLSFARDKATFALLPQPGALELPGTIDDGVPSAFRQVWFFTVTLTAHVSACGVDAWPGNGRSVRH
jgi:hypothetical protein